MIIENYFGSGFASLKNIISNTRFWVIAFATIIGILALWIFNSWNYDTDTYIGSTILITSTTTLSLRELIHDATTRGKASSSLNTRKISPPLLIKSNGIDFAVSYADFTPKDEKININQAEKPDPFDPANREANLLVAFLTVKSDSRKHSLVSISLEDKLSIAGASSAPSSNASSVSTKHLFLQLNKFNTLPDHTLLVTHDFEPQTSPLDLLDLSAWFYAVTRTNSVGFFNSDWTAGASQRHKHMQIIPQDVFWSLRPVDALYPLPVDHAILPFIISAEWLIPSCMNIHIVKYPTYRLSQFKFRHSVAVLQEIDDSHSSQKVEDHTCQYSRLFHAYCAVMKDIGVYLHACTYHTGTYPSSKSWLKNTSSYNIIITPAWIMAVARSKRGALDEQIGVNSYAFIGLLLTRGPNLTHSVVKVGPMEILNQVTVPV